MDKRYLNGQLTRRELLTRSRNGIGALALANLIAGDLQAAGDPVNPLSERPQHFKRKAKHCIFMFMVGGVSQIDSFEYKPALQQYAGKQIPHMPRVTGELAGFLQQPHRIVPSPVRVQEMRTARDVREFAVPQFIRVCRRHGLHPRHQSR